MSNRQARRRQPATPRRLGLPRSNLKAVENVPIDTAQNLAMMLRHDAGALEIHAHKEDRRTRSIIRQMRRVAQFYQDVIEQRET
jgi:hypothetical protein